jgi:hypothetical protein
MALATSGAIYCGFLPTTADDDDYDDVPGIYLCNSIAWSKSIALW